MEKKYSNRSGAQQSADTDDPPRSFLSVVIPVYNSDESLERLVHALRVELDYVDVYEIILVNDGSTNPATDGVCRRLAGEFSEIVYLQLSRNFGEHNAVMAGLNACSGHHAVLLDDDFQNPPEAIRSLYDASISGGYDVVYSYYEKKQHHFFRNWGSKLNDLVACYLLRKPKELYLCSFKLINRFLIDEIIRYSGPYPYIDGLILRTTDHIGKVQVEHRNRDTGQSNYTLRKLIRLWLNMFTNFSVRPLRAASLIGVLLACSGFFMAVVFFVERLLRPTIQEGWASLVIIVLIMSGVQLFAIGLVGEYLGRLYLKSNAEPQFIVRHRYGQKTGTQKENE